MSNEIQVEAQSEPNVIWGYVFSVVIPIAGFFFGAYLMAKRKFGHGAACMGISIAFALVWLILFPTVFKPFNKQDVINTNLMAEDAREKPDANLQPVQGAYCLWNLGEKVSDS